MVRPSNSNVKGGGVKWESKRRFLGVTIRFSPWLGCSRVSIGCQSCYAAAMAGRLGVVWGPGGTRRRTAESTWKQVERWNRKAACRCRKGPFDHEHEHWCPQRDRPRVFPSLCDPFEDWQGPILDSNGDKLYVCTTGQYAGNIGDFPSGRLATMDDVRRDFFALIDRCRNLDFLLLTKRPENVRRMWPENALLGIVDESRVAPGPMRDNVWLLYSASDQEGLEAGLPHLMACRDLVPVIGLSLEPLVGPVDISAAVIKRRLGDPQPNWVIAGGESGPRARPMEIAWLESIADQCAAAGVPLFVKQDCGRKAGQQGRIPDRLWTLKQFPRKDA